METAHINPGNKPHKVGGKTNVVIKIIATFLVLVGALLFMTFWLIASKKAELEYEKNSKTEQGTTGNNETPVFMFPTSGKNVYATRDNPAKAGLCPLTSKTSQVNNDPSRISRARYILASDHTRYFDSPGPDSTWHKMPTSDYLIYPIDPLDEGIGFSWGFEH